MTYRYALLGVLSALSITTGGAALADITEKLRPGFPPPKEHPTPECRLPALGEPLEALRVGEHTPRAMEMTPQYVIVLLDLKVAPSQDGTLAYDVRKLPDLPGGGVWFPDLCGAIETQRMRIPPEGERLGVAGLRMRPSLDLAERYPKFGAELAASGRTVRTKPKRRYAAFRAFENDEQILRDALLDNSLVAADRSLWTMPGLILIPLR